ncbi:MAG: hypothetical protein JXR72_04815 [Proteobacteria bacterium]|nr:hypothetical protein [Pseudomonadota bacterium]
MVAGKLFLPVILVVGLSMAVALAAGQTPAERGKVLFDDPGFAGGTTPCSACHPDGRGLEDSGEKNQFNIGGKTQNSLEEAVNYCIVAANGGKEIPVDSSGMKDMVAYIKSLQ